MKKVLAYFLLVIFLFNLLGYSIILELGRHLVRMDMAEQIRSRPEVYTVLEVPDFSGKSDFHRLKKNEIEYQGKLRYDVICEFRTSNMTVFHCIRDIREENLSRTAGVMGHENYCHSLAKLLVKDALPVNYVHPGISILSLVDFSTIPDHYHSVYLPAISPPPEYS